MGKGPSGVISGRHNDNQTRLIRRVDLRTVLIARMRRGLGGGRAATAARQRADRGRKAENPF